MKRHTQVILACAILLIVWPAVSGAQWNTSGNNINNTNSGNVGIGTTSPQAKLHIADGDLVLQNTVAGYPRLYLKDISGTLRLRIDYNSAIAEGDNLYLQSSSGNVLLKGNYVGIGTIAPVARLHITGVPSIATESRLSGANYSGSWFSYFGENGSNPDFVTKFRVQEDNVTGLSNGFAIAAERYNGTPRYSIGTKDNTPVAFFTNGTEQIRITSDGNVGVGTSDTKGYKFAVNGEAIFTKVMVKQYSAWPDYVFDRGYKLPTLEEVEAFIKQHKHLQDVPSVKEVNDHGLDLAKSQAGLLKNVEELTLHLIRQNKLLQEQQQVIQQLRERVEKLEKRKGK